MDRDTTTRTGARAPGVKRHGPLERWCISASRPSTQNEDQTLPTAGCTKGECKPCDTWITSSGRPAQQARSAPPPYPASCDLFRCESATLRTHWVLVVMDQFTRRIVGFGVQGGIVDGAALCRMFQRAIRGQTTPNYLSTDNDPLYRFHQWQANLRVLEVTEIKTVPYVPLSHPFVERLVGTLRRECLDRALFWTTTDLEAKLLDFQHYYNEHRTHTGCKGHPPEPGVNVDRSLANLSCYRWQKHCRGLYQTPIAA
jgi:transposase InsO family protein